MLNMKYLFFWMILVVSVVACKRGSDQTQQDNKALEKVMDRIAAKDKSTPLNTTISNELKHHAVILDAQEAGAYTYVKLEDNGKQFWAAITARPVEVGKAYDYTYGIMMKDFESKQLAKTFDSVMFIQHFTEAEALPNAHATFQKSDPHSHTKTRLHKHIEMEPAEGGQTIADIFDNPEAFKNREVKVKGQVVKISKNIMKRNWIHIQDGTQSGQHYDLTITTRESVNFSIGEVVTFTGTLSVNKDFGAGYIYDAIVEDASWHQ
jgi:hypothetical protein